MRSCQGKLVLLCAGRETYLGGENDSGEVEGLWRDHLWGRGAVQNCRCATSKSKAASILNITIYQMNSWWTETLTSTRSRRRCLEPGAIFSKPLDGRDPFVKQEG